MIAADLVARLQVLIDLGLGYLTLSRRTPTVSPGELQRLRLATQLRAGLFGVLYVLDEPSAGLHPRTPNRCSRCLIAFGARVIRCSWSSMTWTWYVVPIGSSTSDRGRAS